MKVNEIFLSIQGEGLSSGFPTIFVRFTGCNLKCSYCDTIYAYYEGTEMTPAVILEEIEKHQYKRVCLTGGEPLLQKDISQLLEILEGYSVSIETNGSLPIWECKRGNNDCYVMDMKAPTSGCSESMMFENFNHLKERDEIKFVIGNRNDYDWAKGIIKKHHKKGTITISPVFGEIKYDEIVSWIIEDRLDVRFQLQLQKVIWGEDAKGV